MQPKATGKTSLVQIVNERIKQYIVEHGLKSGDRLPYEREWVEQLQVSRTVVREALKSLQFVGIVRIKSGDGIYVDDPSMDVIAEQISFRWKMTGSQMKELLDTRIVLELGAIEMAVRHADIALLNEIESRNERLLETIDQVEYPKQEDMQFHLSLFQATGNALYCELSSVVHHFFRLSRLERLMDKLALKQSLTEHQQIIQAMKQKNADEAKAVMLCHLQRLYQYI